MARDAARIIRFDEPFDEPSSGPPHRIVRNVAVPGEQDAPAFRLKGVLRSSDASITGEAREVQLRTLQADFPLPEVPPTRSTDPPPADEATIRERIESEWRARLEDTVLTVREEAYDAGYATAREELQAVIEENAARVEQELAALRRAFDAHLATLEHTAVSLAVTAASSVLDAPLDDAAIRATEQALAHAVEQLAGDGAVEIVLHPIDLLRMQEQGFEAQLSSAFPGLRWSPDETMTEGDWSARSSEAVVRRIRQEMLDLLGVRLGLDIPSRP